MLQFPDVEAMTPEQAADNEAACSELQRGKYYKFNPPVEATAIPTGGPTVWEPRLMRFSRGWYLGFREGNHFFQGKPDECPDDIDERLQESYFCVLFIGGVVAEVDENQDFD